MRERIDPLGSPYTDRDPYGIREFRYLVEVPSFGKDGVWALGDTVRIPVIARIGSRSNQERESIICWREVRGYQSVFAEFITYYNRPSRWQVSFRELTGAVEFWLSFSEGFHEAG